LPTSGTTVLICALVLAAVCASALWVLQRASGRRDRSAWVTFAMQLLLAAWVLVPAWLGTTPFMLAMVLVAISAGDELASALRAALHQPKLLDLLLGHSLPLLCVAPLLLVHAQDARHIYFYYAAIELNDSFAFIVGRSLGRTPAFPRLSPGKTREGLVAGWVAASATGAALSFFEPHWSRPLCALIGLVLGIAATLADLAASWLKRRAQLKDFSDVLPGHGGVLDAYDSLLLAAPVWYLLVTELA
jgi:CDP-diglyceride synthetase